VTISYVTIASPLGPPMIGATDRGLCFVQFGDSEMDLPSALLAECPAARVEPIEEPRDPEFQKWVDALTRRLSGS
jgi:AraC family transcriptional regulator of adaptative response/methylated-DNA-[protein]-cysteine methyltransferase